MITRWRSFYGEHPLHLLVLLGCAALAGFAVLHVLANPRWPVMALWFAAAIVGHDLIVFPAYALFDKVLHRNGRAGPGVNYVRIPLMAIGLTFLLFFPGILRSGADTYLAATGLTQEPFLARWLLLCAGFCATSLLVFVVRTAVHRARNQPVRAVAPAHRR
jgi:hypothetical protein